MAAEEIRCPDDCSEDHVHWQDIVFTPLHIVKSTTNPDGSTTYRFSTEKPKGEKE